MELRHPAAFPQSLSSGLKLCEIRIIVLDFSSLGCAAPCCLHSLSALLLTLFFSVDQSSFPTANGEKGRRNSPRDQQILLWSTYRIMYDFGGLGFLVGFFFRVFFLGGEGGGLFGCFFACL